MRRLIQWILPAVLLASCAPTPDTPAAAVPTSTPILHNPQIRFAVVGEANQINPWQLFDASGAGYADYAVRYEYWPRLFSLTPTGEIHPQAAEDFPSEIIQEDGYYTATLQVRTDLKWSDNSPFTAEDVIFTLETARVFELSHDWAIFYAGAYLERVEAPDARTIKYYFKQKPHAGVWYYGILQGVILQKTYWQPRIGEALALLPSESEQAEIQKAREYAARVQADVDRLLQSQQTGGELNRRQEELIYANGQLNKLLQAYNLKIQSAQAALFALDSTDEPLLGTWQPASQKDDVWINDANPAYPFVKPHFDHAEYHFYPDERSALAAYQQNQADVILSPQDPTGTQARYLVVNPLRVQIFDTALRRALSCMLDRNIMSIDALQAAARPLDGFVISPHWHNPNAKDPCKDMAFTARVESARTALRQAGYSWQREPDAQAAGSGLRMPGGEPLPAITLLTPGKDEDGLRYAAAQYIAEQAQYLGMRFNIRESAMDDINYAVFSSQKYDMALMGWRLSEYPAFLCEWFDGANPYLYNGSRYADGCAAARAESNLEKARQVSFQIEAALMEEMPFIPLFMIPRAEQHQNISYPQGFGAYGSPSYAVPAP